MARHWTTELRRRIYLLLEQGPLDRGIAIDRLLVTLIVVNLFAVALESVPAIGGPYKLEFDLIEIFSLVVFTVEYGLRLWCAVDHAPYRHRSAMRSRIKYVTSLAGIIDLFAVLPFVYAFTFEASTLSDEDLRRLRDACAALSEPHEDSR